MKDIKTLLGFLALSMVFSPYFSFASSPEEEEPGSGNAAGYGSISIFIDYPVCGNFPYPICGQPQPSQACLRGDFIEVEDELNTNGSTKKYKWTCERFGISRSCEAVAENYCADEVDLTMDISYSCGDSSIKITTISPNTNPDNIRLNLQIDEVDENGNGVRNLRIYRQPRVNGITGKAFYPIEYNNTGNNYYIAPGIYNIHLSALTPDGDPQSFWTKSGQKGNTIGINRVIISEDCDFDEPEDVPGCTDTGAINHNANATVDDGSCTYDDPENIQEMPEPGNPFPEILISGCTSQNAENYEPNATVDDGSCTYEVIDIIDVPPLRPEPLPEEEPTKESSGEVTTGPVCGNRITETGEQCDDGNNQSYDGCSATCEWEFNNQCLDHDNNHRNNCREELITLSQLLTPLQLAELPEDVDPNKIITIGYLPRCGDGVIWDEQDGFEECDDGNNQDGDGCSSLCFIETQEEMELFVAEEDTGDTSIDLQNDIIHADEEQVTLAKKLSFYDKLPEIVKLILRITLILIIGLIATVFVMMQMKRKQAHIVQEGETIASIANMYAITERKLRQLNKKNRRWKPVPGKKISVPNRHFVQQNLLDQLKETLSGVLVTKLGKNKQTFSEKKKISKTERAQQLASQIQKNAGFFESLVQQKKGPEDQESGEGQKNEIFDK